MKTVSALLVVALLAASGDPDAKNWRGERTMLEDEVGTLKAKVSQLQGNIRELQGKAEITESLANELCETASRLSYEQWDTVVPEFEEMAESVRSSAIETATTAKYAAD